MRQRRNHKHKHSNAQYATRDRFRTKYRSTAHYVLSSLIPYTEANLKLAFKPNQFFNDLEKIGQYKAKRATLVSSYYRLIESGLVEIDNSGTPHLTSAGESKLRRYEPTKLTGTAYILVIFDIPENERRARQALRATLRALYFEPVQQSVWQSKYNVLEYLVAEIKQKHLTDYVQVYESARII